MTERFSASVAGRLMACPASANLDLAIPNWTPPVRNESMGSKATGTTVHKVIEDLVKTKTVTASGEKRFNARDMMAAGRLMSYIGEVWSRRRFTVLSEETVEASWLVGKPTTTADLVLYTKDEIHVIDAKWGKIPVEVIENEQLMFYAVCYAPLAPKAKGVTVHIAQPHADNMAEWFIPADRLKQFMDDAIQAEAKILAGDTTFGPTDTHCTFCPANPHSRGDKGKPLCPAMMDLLYPKLIDEDEILADM